MTDDTLLRKISRPPRPSRRSEWRLQASGISGIFGSSAALSSVPRRKDPALQARIIQGTCHIPFFLVLARLAARWTAKKDRVAYRAQPLTFGWTEVDPVLFLMLPGLFPPWRTAWIGWVLRVAAIRTRTPVRVRSRCGAATTAYDATSERTDDTPIGDRGGLDRPFHCNSAAAEVN